MCNSNFDNNGVDKSGTHWLQYAAFEVITFDILAGNFQIKLASTIL